MEYQQPQFYRFNSDSILLVNKVFEDIKNKQVSSILDIGAGVGVLGIELSHKLQIKKAYFVEIQPEFLPYLENNLRFLKKYASHKIICDDIFQIETSRTFDLIVSNPPYFKQGHGRTSSNKQKQICRTLKNKSISEWIDKMISFLSPTGTLYFLLSKLNPDYELILSRDGIEVLWKEKDIFILKFLNK